jgi:hypothetical protein
LAAWPLRRQKFSQNGGIKNMEKDPAPCGAKGGKSFSSPGLPRGIDTFHYRQLHPRKQGKVISLPNFAFLQQKPFNVIVSLVKTSLFSCWA